MGLVAAIVGLAALVMIHEAGHFFAARAVGMTPRKFYLGFGPPIVKRTRGVVEYGIGAFPLGGYVKIPGMNRPSPGTLAATLPVETRERHQAELARLDDAIEREDDADARAVLAELRPELGDSRDLQELEWSFAPDAYWRQATWRRLVAIGAGPAVNLVFAFLLFTALLMVATEQETNIVARVVTGSPAASAGLKAGDRVVRVAGESVAPKEIPHVIQSTRGRASRSVVLRHGRRTTVGPLRAKPTDGAYRIGIGIEGRTGPGESVRAAARDSLSLAWSVTSDTVTGLGHLATGRDTGSVSS